MRKYQEKYGALRTPFLLSVMTPPVCWPMPSSGPGSPDSKAVRDALAETAGFGGVTGQISFDANRNASKPGLIVTVKGGKFEIAEKIAP